MNLFIDNNLPPLFGDVFDAYLGAKNGGQACHARKNKLGITGASTDIDWMNILSNDSNDWIVLTGDRRIRRNQAEFSVWIDSGLKGIVPNATFRRQSREIQLARIFMNFNDIESNLAQVLPGTFFDMNANGRIRRIV